jgi:hypothetical protein
MTLGTMQSDHKPWPIAGAYLATPQADSSHLSQTATTGYWTNLKASSEWVSVAPGKLRSKFLLTDKYTWEVRAWQDNSESFRVDMHMSIRRESLDQFKVMLTHENFDREAPTASSHSQARHRDINFC